MKEHVFWATDAALPSFNVLEKDIKTDVLVIGGGMTGLLVARLCRDAGFDVTVLEAGRICRGQTGGTTAKITTGHGFCYTDIAKRFGKDGARLFFEANHMALERLVSMAEQVRCCLEKKDMVLYEKGDIRVLERELAVLGAIGAKADFLYPTELPFSTVGAIRIKGQAQFQPLSFLAAQLEGLNIYENSPVVGLFEGGAVTQGGARVRAAHTVVATHFPFLRFRGGYAFKMYQSRSYAVALENAPLPQAMYADGAGKGVALRSYGDLLLVSGAAHRTGTPGEGYRALEEFCLARYGGAQIVARFAAQDCMTLDGMPYIGRYAKGLKGVYVATGYEKWGMTSAMLAAILLCDEIAGHPNPYAPLFAPTRPLPPLRFLRETGAVLRHYVRPTVPRCPHLGCALRYNKQEHSWDCPCHGSRFAPSGSWLNGPAISDLSKKP